jgi:UDP-N-acetylmuramoyl-tripeptide--D-alanyl-D-alanine ligase
MKELGATSADEHRRLGEEIAADGTINAAYFFGNDMGLAHRALDGTAVRSHAFTDKPKLIEALQHDVTPADLVLIKGSRSMKMEEVVAGLV